MPDFSLSLHTSYRIITNAVCEYLPLSSWGTKASIWRFSDLQCVAIFNLGFM